MLRGQVCVCKTLSEPFISWNSSLASSLLLLCAPSFLWALLYLLHRALSTLHGGEWLSGAVIYGHTDGQSPSSSWTYSSQSYKSGSRVKKLSCTDAETLIITSLLDNRNHRRLPRLHLGTVAPPTSRRLLLTVATALATVGIDAAMTELEALSLRLPVFETWLIGGYCWDGGKTQLISEVNSRP